MSSALVQLDISYTLTFVTIKIKLLKCFYNLITCDFFCRRVEEYENWWIWHEKCLENIHYSK